jgi:hypothetical protein
LAPVARIGADGVRFVAHVSFDLFQHRQQLPAIVGLLR